MLRTLGSALDYVNCSGQSRMGGEGGERWYQTQDLSYPIPQIPVNNMWITMYKRWIDCG